MKKTASFVCALLMTALFLTASDDAGLLFHAGFNGGLMTADKAAGKAEAQNFQNPELGELAGEGIGGNGAMFLDNTKTVIYPGAGNIDWREGTISMWLSAQNWKPSDKRFQIFFEARFPNESSRILIYKYYENSTLRFMIVSNNKEAGYISVPMKDADWQPGMWHKLDAVWNCEKMLLYIDGKLTKSLTFKQALNIQGGDSPKSTLRLGINPGFRNNNGSDVTGYDEVRIFKRMLSAEEIAANYNADRSSKAAAAPAVDDAALLFHAGFDSGMMTADKAAGKAEPQNFQKPELGELAGEGVAGNGAMFLDNTKTVIYPGAENIDWREGTISMWLSAQNWKPSDKRFQIFFEARFPNESSRILIYKYYENSTLRFMIVSNNKEAGYISVPMKDADWQPGMWHKLDAVWNCEKMLLYIDGKLTKTITFKQALNIQGGDSPKGTIRLGINPGFSNNNKSDVTGYDEVRIFKRMLNAEEIAAGYKADRSGNTAEAAPAVEDADLLFHAGFDGGVMTADKAAGKAEPQNFKNPELGELAGKGVADKGAMFLDNTKTVIYPAAGNIDWREGTISMWLSAQNWKPSDKHFQIFFEGRFPNESSRFIIYKYFETATLRFLIASGNKEVGYISVPVKDADWQPGMWHKLDAVWNCEKMLLYIDGKLMKTLTFKQALDIKGGDSPQGTIRLGINPGFSNHNKSDVTGYDEFRIFKRMLSAEEIAAGYKAERSGKTAAAAQDKKKSVIESKPAAQKAAAAAPAQKEDASLQDPSLLFKATFDTYSVTAEKGKGGCKSTNFVPDNLMLRMHPGVAQVGNALTLNNRESAIYPNKDNFDWRKGTISLWVSARNWLPSKKKFQIFFQSKFTHDTRFIVYKFVDPADLRFIIVVKNKQIGYVHVPLKDSEWQPDVWHKIDAVWDEKSMALYLDGNLAAQQPYTHNPFQYRSPLEIPDEVQPRFMQIGMDSSFGHDPDDVTAFDEVEIYDRMLTPAEIRQGYEKFIKPVNTGDNPNMVTLPEGKPVTLDGKLDEAEWADAAVIPVANLVRLKGTPLTSAQVYLKHDAENMLIGAEIVGGAKASLEGNDLVDVWRDDSFEIHLMNSAKKRYQFIVNPLGAMYDAVIDRDDGRYDMTNLNSKWSSGAKRATSRGDGRWFLEMSISKSVVGAGNEMLGTFCATRYLDKGYHVAWGMNAENFYDENTFGRIIFGGAVKPVRFIKYAPYQGHFDLNKDVKLNLVFAGGKTIARPDGIGEWKLDLPSGIYDLSAKCSGYNFSSRFTIDQPLVVSYNCYASRNTLEVKADLSAAGSALRDAIRKGTVKGTVKLVNEAGKVFIREEFTPKDVENIVNLKLPELPQGIYFVEGVVQDGKGGELQARKRFRVPDMTPYKLKVAQDHTVPRPWTPVKQLSKKKYEVWNRTFTFGDGPFPVQVVSDGADLLKEAPNFHLDGKPVKWSGFKVTEKHDDYVRFEGTGAAGNLTFRWTSDLCFDGLVKTKIHMKPAKGTADISDLRLKWSVPAEFARVMLEPLYSGWRNNDGEVYNFAYGHGEDFIIWTMGLEKGFLYWPSSNANWVNPAGHKQFSLTRKGDTVHANADYITQKATLTKEATYSLAFMATPGRPVPERRRDFNLGQIWDFLKYETAKIQYFGVSAKPAPESTEPWTSLKPLDPVKFGQHIKDIASKGSSYLPYSQPARTCTVEESYDYFFPEWRQIPGWPVGGGISHLTGEFYYPEATCGHTGAGDLFVYRADKLLTDFPDLPGLYYDICEGRICWNTLHGCGGVDAFGKKYGDSNMMTHRDYFIRIKRVVDKHGPEKVLILHAHNRFVPFCHGLGDYWFPGEQYSETIITNLEHFYCENIPLKEWQSAYRSEAHGPGLIFSSLYQSTMWRYKLPNTYRDAKYTLSVMAPVLLHDLNLTNGYAHHRTVERWWIIKHDIDLAAADFHGYWFSDAVKTKSEKVYASWYSWKNPSPYRRLIVVGNIGRTEQPAALEIDEKALGIDGAKVKYYDLWEDKEITDLSTLKVGGNNFKLIGIK